MRRDGKSRIQVKKYEFEKYFSGIGIADAFYKLLLLNA